MGNINVNIRVDEGLKKKAEILFGELGLNMSTAMNLFLRKAVMTKSIPFTLEVEESPYNKEFVRKILEGIEQYKQGDSIERDLIEV